MVDERPLWRRMFDTMDGSLAPRLEQFVRTEQFADIAATVGRLQADFQRRAERSMRQAWHFWNLPTGSDVKRVSEQLTSLERRMRDLTKQLEDRDLDEELRDG